jgi:hypothetical protein
MPPWRLDHQGSGTSDASFGLVIPSSDHAAHGARFAAEPDSVSPSSGSIANAMGKPKRLDRPAIERPSRCLKKSKHRESRLKPVAATSRQRQNPSAWARLRRTFRSTGREAQLSPRALAGERGTRHRSASVLSKRPPFQNQSLAQDGPIAGCRHKPRDAPRRRE